MISLGIVLICLGIALFCFGSIFLGGFALLLLIPIMIIWSVCKAIWKTVFDKES